MSKYHERTLALLGEEGVRKRRPVPTLITWARKNSISLPAALLEWAQLDGEKLLRKYSNDDWFEFDGPSILETPDGTRGLLFHRENQGNFSQIAVLEDPRVLFGWIGQPPWITYTERFSDAVYAQIFDWQYMLEFDPEDPDYKEITFYADLELKSSRCLDVLRQRFQEVVTTHFCIQGTNYTDYRFLRSLKERITVTVEERGSVNICVTGERSLVGTLEAELLELLSADTVQRTFLSLLEAIDFISSALDAGLVVRLRHACTVMPTEEAVRSLSTCHKEIGLRDRLEENVFPDAKSQHEIGGKDWGIRIRFRKSEKSRWVIDSIR
jgi:hypothetical protein